MIDLNFHNIVLSFLIIFFISFIITFFIKNNSSMSPIINRLISSGLISLTFLLCLLLPSKSWIWIFNLFFMFYIKSVIENNLYISAKKSGIPENTILEMIALLGFSVDLQREIRKGDSFEILFTKKIDILSDEVIQTKPITYVSIILSGKRLNYYNFEDKYGLPQYYDEKGKSSKRTIMKTPINGARLSSKYGNRKHPILGYTKMHRGLDFAAPTGTPVFAAGDGIVEKAGWNGSYGKYIRIRHTGTYKTAYAHLSGFHKNIKVGKRISQGKTIGYVGSTGRSTGPHLHYEVIKNNVQVNPMRIKIPAGKNIPKSNILDYQNHIKNILSLKIILEKSIDNKKLATNNYSNSKPLIFN